VLETQNKNYAEALSYEKEKKYSLALLAYQKALPEAKDKIQSAQIQLKVAIMNEWLGNYGEAITQLKAIAADTTNYAIARAYAVQEIGFMNIYTTGEIHQLVFVETFKDAPYSSFKESENLNMTYTKLFEYATNIYPLGYSESYVAYGYSGEILNSLHRATTTSEAIEYISLTKQALQAADMDIKRMRAVPGEQGIVPVALAWQGVALSRLASVGVVDPKQAEPYFKESVTYGAALGDRPGNFNAFNYAAFLVYHYGNARVEDIKNLLLPFRVNNDTQIYPQVTNFYKTVRADKSLQGDKKQIISMAQIDPNFKEYLISLGWKKADF
jgi:tetratricopeptide (TPR) repeat protein